MRVRDLNRIAEVLTQLISYVVGGGDVAAPDEQGEVLLKKVLDDALAAFVFGVVAACLHVARFLRQLAKAGAIGIGKMQLGQFDGGVGFSSSVRSVELSKTNGEKLGSASGSSSWGGVEGMALFSKAVAAAAGLDMTHRRRAKAPQWRTRRLRSSSDSLLEMSSRQNS